jgi:hypothetical protein
MVMAACLSLGVPQVQAANGLDTQFSAEAVQTSAKGEQGPVAKMFVGGNGMRRTEYSQNNQRVVQIAMPEQGMMWMVFPDQGSYMERRMPSMASGGSAGKDDNPCAGQPGLNCRLLGEETIDGRQAKKWEVSANRQGQVVTTTQWIDNERGFPVRQEMPRGGVMELKMTGTEQLRGRSVEKWEMVMTPPEGQGQPIRSVQWFDPELEIAIREELPDGSVRELRNIQVGAQPESLFQVPAGYQKVEPPAQQPMQRR